MTTIYILILAAMVNGEPQVIAPMDFTTKEQCEQAGREAIEALKQRQGLDVLALCAKRTIKGQVS